MINRVLEILFFRDLLLGEKQEKVFKEDGFRSIALVIFSQ